MIKLICLIVSGFVPLSIHATINIVDTQFWTQAGALKKLNDTYQLMALNGYRFEDDASQLFFKYGEVGLVWKMSDRWTVIGSYRQSYLKSFSEWLPEGNPRLTATWNWEDAVFVFYNRNRLEWRSLSNHFLYRNRMVVEFPYLLSFPLTPYIGNEIFLDKLSDLTQNRLQGGMTFPLTSWIQTNIGYIYRLARSSDKWVAFHVFACYLDMEF